MEFKPICWLVCTRTHLNVIVTGGPLGLSHWATTLGFSWLILQVSYSSLLTLYTRYLSSSSVPRTPRAPGPPPRGQMMFSWSNSNGELPDRCHLQLLFRCKELRKRLKDYSISLWFLLNFKKLYDDVPWLTSTMWSVLSILNIGLLEFQYK